MADWIINNETGLIFPANPYNKDAKGCSPYQPTQAEIVAGKALRGEAQPPPMAIFGMQPSPQVTEEITIEVEPNAPSEPIEPAEADKIQRNLAIQKVVAGIETEFYGKPTGGRPAMPKVEAVSSIAGFKVSADEILEAMKALGLTT